MALVRWIVDTATVVGTWEEYDAVYGNLETAMAAAYDLVIAQESVVIECTCGADTNADTTAVVVDGWTVSADYTLTIQAHENDKHNGVWSDNKYRLSGAAGSTITLVSPHTLSTIQIITTGAANDVRGIYTNTAAAFELISLFCTSTNTGTGNSNVFSLGTVNINTSIFNDFNEYGLLIAGASVTGDNLTLEGNIGGINITSGTCVANSAISLNNASDFDAGCTGDHNVSSDLTAPGTNTVHSFDHATLFPNAATGDFRPAIPYVNAFGTTWGAGAIPWQRDVLVDTNGGGDYTSLSAAEAGEQIIGDNLALRNEKMVISCTSGGTATADTAAVAIDANWSTNESCTYTIQAHADDRHVGIWDDSKFQHTVTTASTAGIYAYAAYGLIDGLQIKTNVSSTYGNIRVRNCADVEVVNCLSIGSLAAPVIEFYYATGAVKAGNNIISGSSGDGIAIEGTGDLECFSNTVTNCGANGISRIGGTLNAVNNSVSNSTTNDFTGTITGLTNISSDGTAPDNAISYTVYDAAIDTLPVVPEDCVIFKDIVANDFRLVSHFVEDYKGNQVETNSAIGNGTYLYDVATDCAGKSRQPYNFKAVRTQRAFDIGAWQAPAQITYVVDTDGVSGDYSTAATAFAGLQADSTDLVSDNLLPIISCQASTSVADAAAYVVSGIVDSNQCYLTIEAEEGHRHSYIWDDTKYKLVSGSAFTMLKVVMAYAKVQYLQLENTRADTALGLDISTSKPEDESGVLVDSCIVKDCLDAGIQAGSGKSEVRNSIVYGCGGHGILSAYTTADPFSNIHHNITYGNGGYGIRHDTWGVAELADNISSGNTLDDISSDEATDIITNNVSSDLTGDITGLLSTYFTDPGNGNFTPVASAGALTSYSANLNATETVGAIPFTWEKTVGSGKDYADFASWLAAAITDTVTDELTIANCSNTEVATVTITGLDTITIVDGLTVVPVTSGTSGIVIADDNVRLQNCLVYREVNKITGVGIDDNSNQAIIYNSTVTDFLSGVDGLRTKANNVICIGNTTDFNIAVDNWNISSDTTTTGFDSHTGETTALFENYAAQDFRLKSTATNAIGGGADLSTYFTTDITGATREVPWDIGAFLYVAGGGTPYSLTIDSYVSVKNQLTNIFDTITKPSNSVVNIFDTILSGANTILQINDTKTIIINQIESDFDTLTGTSTSIQNDIDARLSVLNQMSAEFDTKIAISEALTSAYDSYVSVSNSISNEVDTKVAVKNQIENAIDTLTSVATSGQYTISFDTLTIIKTALSSVVDLKVDVSNAWESISDTHAVISTSISEIADTSIPITNEIVKSFDSKVGISNQITNLHDSAIAVSNSIETMLDTLATIINQITVPVDTKVGVATEGVFVQYSDTEVKVKNQIELITDTLSTISNTYTNISDTLVSASLGISYIASIDTNVKIANNIVDSIDTLASISTYQQIVVDLLAEIGNITDIREKVFLVSSLTYHLNLISRLTKDLDLTSGLTKNIELLSKIDLPE